MLASILRRRILGSLATSTLLAASCGGQTSPTSSSSSSGSSGASSSGTLSSSSSSGSSSSGTTSSGAPVPTCRDGRKERSCFAPDAIPTRGLNRGGDTMPDAAPPPPPPRDDHGCVVLDEVMNGCCNAAISGPVVEDGECCYEFCAGACCGRPLVVDGAPRVASIASRADWTRPGAHPALVIDDATRAALRDEWSRDALLEHASIASFASFTLELLAIGAPPDFVRDAQLAASDEIEHARLTFAIASRYSDTPIGPGPLDVGGVAPSMELAAVAAACVRDGCVNETIAAAVAGTQAANATDTALRADLERIAEDEARHAELAWRFVKWALSVGNGNVRDAVLAAFDAPVTEAPRPPEGIDAESWRANGRLLAAEREDVVRTVLEHVVAPCRDRLLGLSAAAQEPPDPPSTRNASASRPLG